jgi:1-phosphofructokinase
MQNEQTSDGRYDVVTVTLNPAIDQTVTIPNFAPGKVNRVEEMQSAPGGKGVNVASTLADDGHSVAVTGFLGRDNRGSFEELFVRKHIADHFIHIAGQTRVGIKISDPVQQQTTDINFPGQAPEPTNLLALRRQLATLDATWFVLAGSLPPAVEPSFYRDLVMALKARGRKVVLDSSGEPLRYAIEAAPSIVKPNIHELEALVGATLPTEEAVIAAAQQLLERGIKLVVVSMGKAGACFVAADAVVIARPPDVTVKSTVGAGDAMVAGIIAAQLGQLPLATTARRATAFSLDAITHIGTGISSPGAIAMLMERVIVEEYQG